MNYLKILIVLLAALTSQVNAKNIVINTSNDTLYVYDDFDVVGSALSHNGVSGIGWYERWSYVSGDSNPLLINETSNLTYPSASTAIGSGGYVEKTVSEEVTIERSFINTFGLLGSTFYLSFLLEKDADGAFSLEGYGEDYLRYGLRIGENGSLEVRASNSWGTPSATGVFANKKTYLVVIAKTSNTYSATLFEEGDAIPSDPANVDWLVTNSGKSGVEMDRFQFHFPSGNVKMDELRLGSTWQSVTQGLTYLDTISAPSALALDTDTIDIVPGNSSVELSWVDNADNETGYKIFQDGKEIAAVAADVNSFSVSEMFIHPEYYFNVAAYASEGMSAKSNTAVLFVINASGIVLEQPLKNSVLYQSIPHFSWSHKHAGPFSGTYEIWIDDDPDFSSPLDMDTVPAFINYYSPDFELDYDVDYYWQVRFVDNDGLSEGGWSLPNLFTIVQPEVVIDVMPGDGWDEIRSKWLTVLSTSETTTGAVELRFPEDGVFHIRQDPTSDESERSNGFLLYVDGYDNVLVNGQGSKIILEATHGEWLCGFMEVSNSAGMQVKDIIIDYHPNSIYQIGGVVKNFDKGARTFEVVVDTSVYKTYDVLKAYSEGYFLSKEYQNKVGSKGVAYTMEQTWEQAKVHDTLFQFTCGTSEYGRYSDELEDGDFFVLSHRGGDVVYLSTGVSNFALNNMTTHACRGRFFSVDKGCTTARCINNRYLRTQGRLMGSSSGGVGVDRGDDIWYEGNRYEYSRDDMFHSGSNAGKGSVFRRNFLIGAYRNSIWAQADRSWIADNTIKYAGVQAIHIGYAPTDPGTVPDVVLVEGNTIVRPNWRGIQVRTNVNRPDHETGSIYNHNVIVRNNSIIDNQRDEAILFSYVIDGVVENNTVMKNTTDDWLVYSEEELQLGIHITHSENVTGDGNEILDTRLNSASLLQIDDNCINVDVTVDGPSMLDEEVDYSSSFLVSPNPNSTGIFYSSRNSDYTVFNIYGIAVNHFQNTNTLDLSSLDSGVYILVDKTTRETCQLIKSPQ